MTEEAVTETQTTEAPAQQPTDGTSIKESIPGEIKETRTEKPAGYSPVNLEGLPDEVRKPVEERLNYMYKQIKTNQRVLGEYKNIAKTQSEKIEELMGNVGKVVDHLHTKSIADEEANVKALLRQAHQTGDEEGFITANERLAEIKARKIAAQNQPKPQKQEQQRFARSAEELAAEAEADGEFDSGDKVIVSAYQNERDESGQMLRPWAHSRTPNPQDDPQYMRALNYANAIWNDDRFMTTEQRLGELDRVMGTAKRTASQSVMGGGQLTNTRKSEKITLTPRQQDLAIKLKFGGSKAKSDAEHLEAYRKQIEKVNATKGAR